MSGRGLTFVRDGLDARHGGLGCARRGQACGLADRGCVEKVDHCLRVAIAPQGSLTMIYKKERKWYGCTGCRGRTTCRRNTARGNDRTLAWRKVTKLSGGRPCREVERDTAI